VVFLIVPNAAVPYQFDVTIDRRTSNGRPNVYLVNPDPGERERLCAMLGQLDCTVLMFGSCAAFLSTYESGGAGCLVVDLPRAELNGFELVKRLRGEEFRLPVIVVAERGDVATAVRAMRAGAATFIEKPFVRGALLREVRRLLE
jgi:FixJ family two-component response regulator